MNRELDPDVECGGHATALGPGVGWPFAANRVLQSGSKPPHSKSARFPATTDAIPRPFVWAITLLLAATILGVRAGSTESLVWEQGDGFRSAALPGPVAAPPGFTRMDPRATGIHFDNRLDNADVSTNRLLEIGSGVALGDVDGDGRVDIYFSSLRGSNVLYRNLGNWKFEDVTVRAGVGCVGQSSTGCALVDIDGDGDLDLLVNGLGHGTRLFLNDGTGRFTEVADSGLARHAGATSMAFGDVDGDGDLDLYVTHYRSDTVADNPPGLQPQMRRQADGTMVLEPRDRFVTLPSPQGSPMVLERGEADLLYINRGGGRFVPAPWDKGVFLNEGGQAFEEAPTDWGLAVMFRDLNGDGLPDLYVCNDFIHWPDRLWLNERGRRFRAAPSTTLRRTSLASMAVDAADINRDGFDDIFVADMPSRSRESRAWQRPDMLKGTIQWPIEDPDFRPEVPHNTLQLARGDGTYAEIAMLAGVAATDWTPSALFLDVDLDGWEDLLVAAGNLHDVQDLDAQAAAQRSGGKTTAATRLGNLARLPSRAAASLALRNRRDLTFEDRSVAWGFHALGIAHGMALADLDNDGDLDVVINCMNEPARVCRNNAAAPRIAVRLKGAGANTRGIGAKIKVLGGPVTQSQEMMAGGRYASSDDPMRVFAAGDASELTLEVAWRSGRHSLVMAAKPGRVYEIWEPASNAPAATPPSPASLPIPPLFSDVSARVKHTHVDEPFDDFARQPLLPRKLSTLGPGVAWADVDGDGSDDLLVAGGKQGRTVVFRSDGKGAFSEWADTPFPKVNPRDQTTLLAWRESQGRVRLIAGESNWEDADTNAASFQVLALGGGTAQPPMLPPGGLSATGPLALGDVDGDGQLDLFVGGRALAGRYPEAADSHLWRAGADGFRLLQTFPALGLVSGATFVDLDGHGSPVLALACEWGPIRLFRSRKGQLEPWDPPLRWADAEASSAQPDRLSQLTGWWNGIAAGDFDGDGRMDLVASNWGRNWRMDAPSPSDAPVRLYYGDFAQNGSLLTLLASQDPVLSKVTPWRERPAVMAVLPSVAERFPTLHAYGHAGVEEVLGPTAAQARVLSAGTFDSMVFLNRGDHLEPRRLPVEAQFAPAFGVSVADFDGNGTEDIFLAQNFFGVDAETSRNDAGTGLLLLGDGKGGFRALGPLESGISIHGEQRGSALADFDGDGRIDLAVGVRRGALRLFRNERGASGLRVRLQGAGRNPQAIGAVVRIQGDSGWGPAREIHAGSGYWSQDSATLVLATPGTPRALQIRWPGGTTREWPLPPGARSVVVDLDGISSGVSSKLRAAEAL